MKNIFIFIFIGLYLNIALLSAAESLNLEQALEMLKSQNLEIKNASTEIDAALQDAKIASGNHYGKLDIIQDIVKSDDAGNVFGFKLSSREADFGDFGAKEFMDNFLAGNPDYKTPPHDLNYPDSRKYFQSKLNYEIPLFTGFKISSYEDIMNSVTKIKKLEKSKVVNEKIYETRKSFYDMALLEDSIVNLNIILKNIDILENMTKEMIEVGYAKKIDLLEVEAKKGNVERLIAQMESNKELLYH
ncbi:TolC family protein, partial [Sulfurimonas sp. RIFOXYB12_FULL_35_9]|uniref:TolC family protein n=1 Tax=Sulfurimonas sp. RIFOXYB12_FULL_35_9 TaxID=1802256 RepID=UPI0025F73387